MSSAQLDIQQPDQSFGESEAPSTPFALKEQVAERLAAHRSRRTQTQGGPVASIAPPPSPRARSSRIAAAVAERYAHSQTYRDFIAEEAQRAIREAEAAAEVAAVSARAVAEAQNQLLFELDQIATQADAPPAAAVPATHSEDLETPSAITISEGPPRTVGPVHAPVLTVRHYEDVPLHTPQTFATSHPTRSRDIFHDEAEGLALDEEIAFRQSPVFDEFSTPPSEIPANLIEFPRQLVAPRKVRPRLAEGPLREDHIAPDSTQLRIFEVESTQISSAATLESAAPEWTSILLGAQPAPAAVAETPEARFNPVLTPQTAAMNLRLMAAIVDGYIILATFIAFAAAVIFTLSKLPVPPVTAHLTLQIAALASLPTLAFLAIVYQFLFFTFSQATPGMLYARIGLCTFSDENPTRSAMRRRILAILLSACPFGLGFLWSFFDEDGLGWHDRISRMYQRSY